MSERAVFLGCVVLLPTVLAAVIVLGLVLAVLS